MIAMKQHNDCKSVSNATNIILNIIFILLCITCIVPLILIVSVSFTSESSIVTDGYMFIPKVVSTAAYSYLFSDMNIIGRAYIITIIVTLLGSAINVIICAMYAYAISRKDFPFKGFFTVAVLITLLFSGGIPTFYCTYTSIFHLKDTLLALILPGLGSGFYIIIMRTYLSQSIPPEMIESAYLDGASEVKTFFKLVLPLSLPILATISLFSAIFYWNDFFDSMLFIENDQLYNLQYTMQKAIMNLDFIKNQLSTMSCAANVQSSMAGQIPSEAVRMAMVVVGVGPIILVYPSLQKYFVKGLTIGSVKG